MRLGQANWNKPQRVGRNPVWCIIENAESGSAGRALGPEKIPAALNTTQKRSVLPSDLCLPFKILPCHAWDLLNPPVATEQLTPQVSVGLCALKKAPGGWSVVPPIILACLPELGYLTFGEYSNILCQTSPMSVL